MRLTEWSARVVRSDGKARTITVLATCERHARRLIVGRLKLSERIESICPRNER